MQTQKTTERLRWLGVLPAALLAELATRLLFGGLFHLAVALGVVTPGTSALLYYLRVFTYYTPKEAAFVVAGALVAPRMRSATSVVLAIAAVAISLVVHIVGQSNVGYLNYVHFAAETLGAVAGAGGMILYAKAFLAEPPNDDAIADYIA